MIEITLTMALATILVGLFSSVISPAMLPHLNMETSSTSSASKKAA